MNPKRIAVDFHDNDFWITLTKFGEGLLEIMKKENSCFEFEITKNYIIQLFERSAPGLYWLYQNKLEYDLDWRPETYLKLKPEYIYFDKEIDALLANYCSNGEMVLVDSYLNTVTTV